MVREENAMKINIRPIVLVINIILLVFLFIPIYPVGTEEAGVKSVMNIVTGVDLDYLGGIIRFNEGNGILVVIFTIGSIITSLDDCEDLKKNKGLFIFIQVLSAGAWAWMYWASVVYSATVTDTSIKDYLAKTSAFWPVFVVILNYLLIAAYALLFWKERIDIKNINQTEPQNAN